MAGKTLNGVNPALASAFNAMRAAAAADGINLTLTSGYRSPEYQAKLWAQALKKYGSAAAARKWVAPPGRSQHGFNDGSRGALDIGVNGGGLHLSQAAQQWLRSNAPKFGLHQPLANEPWHWELKGSRSGGAGATTTGKTQMATNKTLNRPTRNNNPGNIAFGEFAKKHGAIGSDGRFAIFPDGDTGFRAMEALLSSDGYRKGTLAGAINRWSPPTDGNPSAKYADFVSKKTGIPADTPMSSLTPAQIASVTRAMGQFEGFNPEQAALVSAFRKAGGSAPGFGYVPPASSDSSGRPTGASTGLTIPSPTPAINPLTSFTPEQLAAFSGGTYTAAQIKDLIAQGGSFTPPTLQQIPTPVAPGAITASRPEVKQLDVASLLTASQAFANMKPTGLPSIDDAIAKNSALVDQLLQNQLSSIDASKQTAEGAIKTTGAEFEAARQRAIGDVASQRQRSLAELTARDAASNNTYNTAVQQALAGRQSVNGQLPLDTGPTPFQALQGAGAAGVAGTYSDIDAQMAADAAMLGRLQQVDATTGLNQAVLGAKARAQLGADTARTQYDQQLRAAELQDLRQYGLNAPQRQLAYLQGVGQLEGANIDAFNNASRQFAGDQLQAATSNAGNSLTAQGQLIQAILAGNGQQIDLSKLGLDAGQFAATQAAGLYGTELDAYYKKAAFDEGQRQFAATFNENQRQFGVTQSAAETERENARANANRNYALDKRKVDQEILQSQVTIKKLQEEAKTAGVPSGFLPSTYGLPDGAKSEELVRNMWTTIGTIAPGGQPMDKGKHDQTLDAAQKLRNANSNGTWSYEVNGKTVSGKITDVGDEFLSPARVGQALGLASYDNKIPVTPDEANSAAVAIAASLAQKDFNDLKENRKSLTPGQQKKLAEEYRQQIMAAYEMTALTSTPSLRFKVNEVYDKVVASWPKATMKPTAKPTPKPTSEPPVTPSLLDLLTPRA